MKIPNKKFVYLISPNNINSKSFYINLNLVLKSNKVKFFQLRLKKESTKKKIEIAKRILKICKKNKVKFIINDNYNMACRPGVNGCHMGQLDGSFKIARSKLKNKILGITCHNSKILAKNAKQNKADYIAFGSFFNF